MTVCAAPHPMKRRFSRKCNADVKIGVPWPITFLNRSVVMALNKLVTLQRIHSTQQCKAFNPSIRR
jgi:hypothetical protein